MRRNCEVEHHIRDPCLVLDGMNTNLRRTLLAMTVLLAAFVGGWAEISPQGFYDSFPGFGLTWISVDGPFNQHLIRDVGSLYLGLGAVSLASIFSVSATPGRVAGLGWAVFGILHFGYHLLHPEGTTFDRIGTVVSLAISLALGILLALPSRRRMAVAGTGTEVGR
jgi:hypothetical protein